MAKVKVKNSKNEELKTVELSDKVFDDRVRSHLVAEVVRYQLAKRQRGTHRAKSRSYVSLTGAKAYAQKGTGRARRGDVRSPILRKGGVPFPPIPRSHAFSLPKKAKLAAMRSVLSDKFRAGKIMVLSEHGLKAIKTKDAVALMQRLSVEKGLIVVSKDDGVLERSLRNVPQFKTLRVEGLNAYDLLDYDQIVIMQDTVAQIETRLQ